MDRGSEEYLLVHLGRDEVLQVMHRLDAALTTPAHPPPNTVAESSTKRLKRSKK